MFKCTGNIIDDWYNGGSVKEIEPIPCKVVASLSGEFNTIGLRANIIAVSTGRNVIEVIDDSDAAWEDERYGDGKYLYAFMHELEIIGEPRNG